jgi:hypothetical protein
MPATYTFDVAPSLDGLVSYERGDWGPLNARRRSLPLTVVSSTRPGAVT